jgi:hypothetical protein
VLTFKVESVSNSLCTVANASLLLVAYKRFADNIPMCIDRTLLRGVTANLGTTLFNGLAVNGPGGYERCRKLLSEPGDVVVRRSELEKRHQRLLLARKELTELFE